MRPEQIALLKIVKRRGACTLTGDTAAMKRLAHELINSGHLTGTLRKIKITAEGEREIDAAR